MTNEIGAGVGEGELAARSDPPEVIATPEVPVVRVEPLATNDCCCVAVVKIAPKEGRGCGNAFTNGLDRRT